MDAVWGEEGRVLVEARVEGSDVDAGWEGVEAISGTMGWD